VADLVGRAERMTEDLAGELARLSGAAVRVDVNDPQRPSYYKSDLIEQHAAAMRALQKWIDACQASTENRIGPMTVRVPALESPTIREALRQEGHLVAKTWTECYDRAEQVQRGWWHRMEQAVAEAEEVASISPHLRNLLLLQVELNRAWVESRASRGGGTVGEALKHACSALGLDRDTTDKARRALTTANLWAARQAEEE